MFFTTELLNQKTSLGIIWLASKHGKKLTRVKVLNSNLTELCDNVMNPTVPHALRLQITLFFGVTYIWHRQTIYLLEDSLNMWSHLKEKFIQGEQLPSAARSNANTNAITLPEAHIDESFLLEHDAHAMNFEEEWAVVNFTYPEDGKPLAGQNSAKDDDITLPDSFEGIQNMSLENQSFGDSSMQGGDSILEGVDVPMFDWENLDASQEAASVSSPPPSAPENQSALLSPGNMINSSMSTTIGHNSSTNVLEDGLLPLQQREKKKRSKKHKIDKKISLSNVEMQAQFDDTSDITQENLKVRQHINLFEKWSLFNRATLATPFRNLLQQRLKPQAEVEEIYAFMRDDEYSFVGDLPDIEYHRAELGDMETDARIRLAEEIGLPVDQIMHPGPITQFPISTEGDNQYDLIEPARDNTSYGNFDDYSGGSFLNNGDDGGQSHGDDDFRLSLGPLYDKRSSNENYARSSSRLRNSTDPGDYPPMSPIPRRWVEEDTSAYGGIPTKLTPPAYTERRQPGGDSFTSVFNLETHQVLTYLRDRTSLGSDANVEPRLQFRELIKGAQGTRPSSRKRTAK